MKINTTKKFLAVVVATSMVFGSTIVAFADENKATGNGIVEYDDSSAVAYDKVTVDTISSSTAFNFRLDPMHMLYEYEPSTYSNDYSVYFTATSQKARLVAADGFGLAYDTYETVEQQGTSPVTWSKNGSWKGGNANGVSVVVATQSTPATLEVDFSNDPQLYVWVPDSGASDKAKYSNGLPGKMVAIDEDNINDWFEPVNETDETKGFKLKEDFRIETAEKLPIDGELYIDANEDLELTEDDAGNYLEDSALHPISEYVTIGDNNAITNKILKTKTISGGQYSDTLGNNVTYSPAKQSKVNYSEELSVVNKSTKAKTVSAIITVKNIEGLDFKAADSYQEGTGENITKDTTASVYVAVDDGSETKTPLALSEDKKTATVTYTKNLAAKAGNDDITYRTKGENAATGGYSYDRYEAFGSTYSANTFKIYATANTNAEAEEAWVTWSKTIAASARPTIEVVYDVKDATTETEAYAVFVQNNFWLGTADGVGFDGLTSVDQVTAFTINDVDVLSKATVGNTFLKVTWSDASSLGVQVATSFTIKATIDGTNYVATFTAN